MRKPTKYENCRNKIIDKIMKEYEKGILKNTQYKIIKNKKQAIAIALSIAGKECKNKYNKIDIDRMIERIEKAIKSNRSLGRSNFNEFLIIYDWYNGKSINLKNLIIKIQLKLLHTSNTDDKNKQLFIQFLNKHFMN